MRKQSRDYKLYAPLSHTFTFIRNMQWETRISVCVITVSKSHEVLLKVRRLSSFISTTTPPPSRRRVVIFSTTTQGIRLQRRVDVFFHDVGHHGEGVHSRTVWCASPLKGHLEKWRGTTRNFSGASRRTGALTIRSCATANGVYRSTVKQRWAIILRYVIL